MRNLVLSLSLICGTAGLSSCVTPPKTVSISSAWVNQCYRSFEHDVVFVAGTEALDCGLLPRQSNSEQQESIKQCTQKAAASGKPFRAGYASSGDDSAFCDVVARSKDGQLWSVYYDADVSGGGGGAASPALWVSRCTELRFEPGTIGAGSYFRLMSCSKDNEIVHRIVEDRKAYAR